MAEYIIKIIRAAFRDIQKLTYKYSEDVAEIIEKISRGDFGNSQRLEGYQDLWRTRKNDLRVIWTRIDNESTILIIKAGLRTNVYRDNLKNRNISCPLNWSNFLNIKDTETCNIPTYEWNNCNSSSWYQFVYGGYLYSPVLTEEQRRIFNEFGSPSNNYHQNRNEVLSFLLQSSPGTGKTVCAALIACELHELYNWNINLILPEALYKEVKEFTKLKQILQQKHDNFFVGTFREWFKQVNLELYAKVASLSEELKALEKKARQIHLINNNETLSFHDLILYQGYVNQPSKFNSDKSPIYLDHKKRISQLSRISPDQWQENLKDKITWFVGLKELTTQLAPLHTNDENNTTLFIFDEAQDYFLIELKFIIEMLNRWKKECNHSTILFLLGDMNQRIQPVDFNWGHLELNETHTLQYNYRNTKKILEFANIFHNLAKKINHGFKKLPEPCSSNNAFEEGESIKLLQCASKDEAFQFLKELNKKIRYSSDVNERSLLRLLSSKVSLIHTGISENHRNLKGINYLSIEQAKGREFDACIAFCVFDGEGQPSFQEANNWYTIFTRPRQRLLVIATLSEITRITQTGQEFFEQCEYYDITQTDELIEWITWSNSEHLFRDGDAICNLIYEGLNAQPIKIYWDTYAALKLAQFEPEKINTIEDKIIKALKTQSVDSLIEELKQIEGITSLIDRILLKCLILRSLNRSWEAVNEASQLQSENRNEYYRLLNVIADELENKQLIYEASRVRNKIGVPFPEKYPFSDNITENKNSLVSLLCHAAIKTITSNLT